MTRQSHLRPLRPRRALTPRQQLRKLQLAVDHIAAVIEYGPDGDAFSDLNEALDHIHHAESAITAEVE